MEAKRLLRSRLSAQRTARGDAERSAAADGIAAHGLALCAAVSTVAAYASTGSEPPTRPLLDALRGAGVRVLLPIADGTALDWAVYAGWDALVRGSRGTPEPTGPRLGRDALAGADLVIVPALGVDRRGHRLGRGAGFYDRALVAVDVGRTIAVVYDDEVVDNVPAQPHDRPVGAVLTPSGVRSVS